MRKLKTFLVLFFLLHLISSCAAKGKAELDVNSQSKEAMMSRIDNLKEGLYAQMKTSKGIILLKLFYRDTPLTVANFIGLAQGKLKNEVKEGPYYDGLTFHRVIEDFMIQGGDPRGNGTGGPGYQFADEIVPSLTFDVPGLLAMANSGPATNGSQFFITHVATNWLNGKHTIFGGVENLDLDLPIVNAVMQGDKIENITIVAKGAEAEAFLASAITEAGIVNPTFADAANVKAKEEFMKKNAADMATVEQLFPDGYKTTARGVFYIVEKEGTGEVPKKGQTVSVHYEGKLLSTGEVFDSSMQRGEPIEFPVGVGYVISGWDEVVGEMKVGEKRKVVIPANLGYGDQGAGGVIPPGAWLIFEIELVALK